MKLVWWRIRLCFWLWVYRYVNKMKPKAVWEWTLDDCWLDSYGKCPPKETVLEDLSCM